MHATNMMGIDSIFVLPIIQRFQVQPNKCVILIHLVRLLDIVYSELFLGTFFCYTLYLS